MSSPCDPSTPFGPPAVVRGLDALGAGSVESLRLSRDGRSGYLSIAGLPDSTGYHDIYVASRSASDAPFANISAIAGEGIDSPGEDLDPTMSGDGLVLLWSSGMPGGDPMHIFYATRPVATVPFVSQGLAPLVNDEADWLDTNPFLRDDGQVLYFASNRVTSDSTDLYRMPWGSVIDGGTRPTPASELNTAFSELAPVVTPDDATIYFGSDRSDGNAQGDYDIWMATRPSAAVPAFAAPVNLTEINSPSLDLPSFASADGCALYFISNRSGALLAYVTTRHPR